MSWHEKTFEELLVGDRLSSCGGYEWDVVDSRADSLAVKCLRSGVITWFKKRRDYWRFLVVGQGN